MSNQRANSNSQAFLRQEGIPIDEFTLNGKKVKTMPSHMTINPDYYELLAKQTATSSNILFNSLFASGLDPAIVEKIKTSSKNTNQKKKLLQQYKDLEEKLSVMKMYHYYMANPIQYDGEGYSENQKNELYSVHKKILTIFTDVLELDKPVNTNDKVYKEIEESLKSAAAKNGFQASSSLTKEQLAAATYLQKQESLAKSDLSALYFGKASPTLVDTGLIEPESRGTPNTLKPNEILTIAKQLSDAIAKTKFAGEKELHINEDTFDAINISYTAHNLPFPVTWEQFALAMPNMTRKFVVKSKNKTTNKTNNSVNSLEEVVEENTDLEVSSLSVGVYYIFVSAFVIRFFVDQYTTEQELEAVLPQFTIILQILLRENLLEDATKGKQAELESFFNKFGSYGAEDKVTMYLGNQYLENMGEWQNASNSGWTPGSLSYTLDGGQGQHGGVFGTIAKALGLAALFGSAPPEESTALVSGSPSASVSAYPYPSPSIVPYPGAVLSSSYSTARPTPYLYNVGTPFASVTPTATPFAVSPNWLTRAPMPSFNGTYVNATTPLSLKTEINVGQMFQNPNKPAVIGIVPSSAQPPPSIFVPAVNTTNTAGKQVTVPSGTNQRGVVVQPSPTPRPALQRKSNMETQVAEVKEGVQVVQQGVSNVSALTTGKLMVMPSTKQVESLMLTVLTSVQNKQVEIKPTHMMTITQIFSGNLAVCGPECNSFFSKEVAYTPFFTSQQLQVSSGLRHLTRSKISNVSAKYPQYESSSQALSSVKVFESFLTDTYSTINFQTGGKKASINPSIDTRQIKITYKENPGDEYTLTEKAIIDIANGGQTYSFGNISLVFDGTSMLSSATESQRTLLQSSMNALKSGASYVATAFDSATATDVKLPPLTGWTVQIHKVNPENPGVYNYAFTVYIPAASHNILSPLSRGFIMNNIPEVREGLANFPWISPELVDIRQAGLYNESTLMSTPGPGTLGQYLRAKAKYSIAELKTEVGTAMDRFINSANEYTNHNDPAISQVALSSVNQAIVMKKHFEVATIGSTGETAIAQYTQAYESFLAVDQSLTAEQRNKASAVFFEAASNLTAAILDPAVKTAKGLNSMYQGAGDFMLFIGEGAGSGISGMGDIAGGYLSAAPYLAMIGFLLGAGSSYIGKSVDTQNANWISVWGDLYNILNLGPAVVKGLTTAFGAAAFAVFPAGLMTINQIHELRPLIFAVYISVYFSTKLTGPALGKVKSIALSLRNLFKKKTQAEMNADAAEASAEAAERQAAAAQRQAAAAQRIAAANLAPPQPLVNQGGLPNVAAVVLNPPQQQGAPLQAAPPPPPPPPPPPQQQAAVVPGGGRRRRRHKTQKRKQIKKQQRKTRHRRR